MAFTSQDLLRNIDFTALIPANAGDHNSLVDSTIPESDKGINLWSVDTALDTPDVPDPTINASYTKFKRYLWLRKPHSTASNTNVILYGWNDDLAVSDITFLKWVAIVDIEDLQADINTALANASAAVTTANNANTTAGNAATQAANAVVTANAAAATAATAGADAATASASAATAQSTANTALSTAQAANAPKTPAGALAVGTPGQLVRTNAGGTAAEWASQGVLQRLIKTLNTQDSTNNPLPYDNSIPQIGEGKEYITQDITPIRADSLIHIHFECFMDKDANGACVLACFQDAIADALTAVAVGFAASGREHIVSLDYYVAAASVNPRTYRIRYGPAAGPDTAYMNTSSAGARFGGVQRSFLLVEEIFGTLA